MQTQIKNNVAPLIYWTILYLNYFLFLNFSTLFHILEYNNIYIIKTMSFYDIFYCHKHETAKEVTIENTS